MSGTSTCYNYNIPNCDDDCYSFWEEKLNPILHIKDRKENWFFKKKLFKWLNYYMFGNCKSKYLKPTKKNFIFRKKFYKGEKRWKIYIQIRTEEKLIKKGMDGEMINKKITELVDWTSKYDGTKEKQISNFGGWIDLKIINKFKKWNKKEDNTNFKCWYSYWYS
jgi:hypothetical protein